MGFRLSFGVGPVRYSTPLGGRKRGRRRTTTPATVPTGCLYYLCVWPVIATVMLCWWTLLLSAWLVWVPVAGIIAGCRKDAEFFKAHWHHPLELARVRL